jgi:hypothetical protein
MRYWWVNQNQTWRQEIDGGYLWSPKCNQNGARNQFYENMRLVEPGDVVFSYFNQTIQNLGIATTSAIPYAKPDFGNQGNNWSHDGWYVPVRWQRLSLAIRPKTIIEQLRPLLPRKYSPLRDNGDGLQSVYLAAVPDEMAHLLLSQGSEELIASLTALKSNGVEGDEAIERLDQRLEDAIKNDTSIDETEREAIVKARRGQGRYRKNLEQLESCCRITGVTDKRLLRASHIKPWRSCQTNQERLDGHNGLLLTPNADHLFDKGYISFEDDGRILISARIDRRQFELLGIQDGLAGKTFSEQQAVYLSFHRSEVFKRLP